MAAEKASSLSAHIAPESSADAPDVPSPARSATGWDGKLRIGKKVEKKLELANPEAISDPEYSDEENVVPGETIEADEGTFCLPNTPSHEYS